MNDGTGAEVGREPSNSYRLDLTGEGLQLRRQLSEEMALKVVALLMGGGISAQSLREERGGGTRRAGSDTGEVTIGEFLEQSGASTNVEKIVAIGVYLAQHEGMERFSSVDVRTRLQAAREPMPQNLPRDIGKAVKERYLHDEGGNIFSVTRTGAEWAEGGFSGARPRRPRPIKRTRRRTAKVAEEPTT